MDRPISSYPYTTIYPRHDFTGIFLLSKWADSIFGFDDEGYFAFLAS